MPNTIRTLTGQALVKMGVENSEKLIETWWDTLEWDNQTNSVSRASDIIYLSRVDRLLSVNGQKESRALIIAWWGWITIAMDSGTNNVLCAAGILYAIKEKITPTAYPLGLQWKVTPKPHNSLD